MKYSVTKDGTKTIEGSPQDIAAYHKEVNRNWGGPRVADTKKSTTKRVVKRKKNRRAFNDAEDLMVRDLRSKGKNARQIAAKLWTLKLSPYKRTHCSVQMHIYRHIDKREAQLASQTSLAV